MTDLYDAIRQLLPGQGRGIVYVSGLGGSGKSTLCDELAAEFHWQHGRHRFNILVNN